MALIPSGIANGVNIGGVVAAIIFGRGASVQQVMLVKSNTGVQPNSALATTGILPSLLQSIGISSISANPNQLFPAASPIRVSVTPSAQIMTHPLETGESFSDHKVIQPLQIQIDTLLLRGQYLTAYKALYQAWQSGETVDVQTKVGYYRNFLISAIPHTEDSDKYDVIPLSITLTEALTANQPSQNTAGNVVSDSDSNTVSRGFINPLNVITALPSLKGIL